jgi:hypothetical protein
MIAATLLKISSSLNCTRCICTFGFRLLSKWYRKISPAYMFTSITAFSPVQFWLQNIGFCNTYARFTFDMQFLNYWKTTDLQQHTFFTMMWLNGFAQVTDEANASLSSCAVLSHVLFFCLEFIFFRSVVFIYRLQFTNNFKPHSQNCMFCLRRVWFFVL